MWYFIALLLSGLITIIQFIMFIWNLIVLHWQRAIACFTLMIIFAVTTVLIYYYWGDKINMFWGAL
jgi:hypothetical protein